MSLDHEAEPTPKRPVDLTRIEPATFRGVDCAVLAERYAVYLRNRDLENTRSVPDVVAVAGNPFAGIAVSTDGTGTAESIIEA